MENVVEEELGVVTGDCEFVLGMVCDLGIILEELMTSTHPDFSVSRAGTQTTSTGMPAVDLVVTDCAKFLL
ncbi:hypothetical protein RUM44_002299 [Polyplax serrata]|uniref:Uncharacterized protein n=1 Tax=Polyplax serrata TaxID=468196 RepID=A0ABR1AMG3_POLSC